MSTQASVESTPAASLAAVASTSITGGAFARLIRFARSSAAPTSKTKFSGGGVAVTSFTTMAFNFGWTYGANATALANCSGETNSPFGNGR